MTAPGRAFTGCGHSHLVADLDVANTRLRVPCHRVHGSGTACHRVHGSGTACRQAARTCRIRLAPVEICHPVQTGRPGRPKAGLPPWSGGVLPSDQISPR